MNETGTELGPPIWAGRRDCLLTHLCSSYLASVLSVRSCWMRLAMVRFIQCRLPVHLPTFCIWLTLWRIKTILSAFVSSAPQYPKEHLSVCFQTSPACPSGKISIKNENAFGASVDNRSTQRKDCSCANFLPQFPHLTENTLCFY